MSRPVALGIDLGTSSLRAMFVSPDGVPVATAARTYGIDSPRPGWAEQDPAEWWRALVDAVADCRRDAPDAEIAAIGFSGQMHGTVLVDQAREIVRPAIIWCDHRSAGEVDGFLDAFGRDNLARHTANPLATGFQLATLLWLARHEPESMARTGTVLLPKDWLRYRITGDLATDSSDACSTLLFDTARRTWSTEVVGAAGLDPSLFPPVREATDVVGEVTESAARELGVPAGTPVVAGGGDQPATLTGNGVIDPGDVLSTIGSGGQLSAPTDAPAYDRGLRMHAFCHAARDRWYIMGAILSAGLSLRWLRENVLGPGAPEYAALSAMAATTPPGAEGLVFLPYLAGERTPHLDPRACGVFFGLTPRHTTAHFVRAVMEGVAMALAEGLDLMRGLGLRSETVIAAGGGARSILWRQIQADVYGCPVVVRGIAESAAFGAALFAGVGAGWWASLPEACRATVRPAGEPIAPTPENADRYRELRALYGALYPRLRDLMAERARIVGE